MRVYCTILIVSMVQSTDNFTLITALLQPCDNLGTRYVVIQTICAVYNFEPEEASKGRPF